MDYKINLFNVDTLKEISNIGTGYAATSLASLIKEKVSMAVPDVSMPEFKELSDYIGGAENIVVAVLVNVSGDITGMMMYVMTEESACSLVNNLLHSDIESAQDFGEMEISAVTEVGNILTSSYLTAISKLLNLKIEKSIPYVSIDMAGAVLSVPAIEFGKVFDRVLFINRNL